MVWCSGSVVGRMNELALGLHRTRLVLAWVIFFGRESTSAFNQIPGTQISISPGLLNGVPVSAGVKVGMSPLRRPVSLCDMAR